MSHTEQEAKEVRCPRRFDFPNQNCLASDCMAWRQTDAPRETMRLPLNATEYDGEPVTKAGGWRIVKGEKWLYEYTDVDGFGDFELLHRAPSEDESRRGYCGLAGSPL